ncbi:MAG: hypothetical protein HY903_19585 [Deltaproteobacteria bacterium]|nr:hypothetical protein [Deltaproteobacteria bacterium]
MLHRVIWAAPLLLSVGCLTTEGTTAPGGTKTELKLENNGTGLEYCDASGQCQTLPYNGDCASLVVSIDTATAETCQTCVRADGTTVDQGCDGTAVACVLVTLPDPDCVVCAYVNGAVLYSSCAATPTNDCSRYLRGDGVACEQCFDPAGRVVFDSCGADCRDVVCPAFACAQGYMPQRFPGECCEQCVPNGSCDGVVCPMESPIPDCPPTSVLVRDPSDCCGYSCQPTLCANATGSDNTEPNTGIAAPMPAAECAQSTDCGDGQACFDGFCQPGCITSRDCVAPAVCMNGVCLSDTLVQCPPGYAWVEEAPYCGQCVAVNDQRICVTDFECNLDEICAFDAGICSGGTATGGATPQGGDSTDPATSVVSPCYGVCRPQNPTCTVNSTGTDATRAFCEGYWDVMTDADGCPYPVCICLDGVVSLDGVCRDLCATVQCFAAPPTCDPGYHLETAYPYCCGSCVPDDLCAYTTQNSAGDPSAGSGTSNFAVSPCADVQCVQGYHPEMGADCCMTCVRDACAADTDCGAGEHCSTSDNVCNPAPGCDPAQGCLGTALCYGECVPNGSGCIDSDSGIDIFTPGKAMLADASGATTTVADQCSNDGLSVVEAYCYRSATGDRIETVLVRCPAVGCVAGMNACWLE